ncbi:MAG: asparagine synthase (glutamine-hydrolyzing) [Nitrospirae bacterium]|nr:asparagine synthase (glutamine-hydrolyzing) [Nitrospirota bacterium]
MCGICGVIGPVERKAIEVMVAALHHRGPDDCGVYHDGVAGMGMARLSILDLTSAAHQPMSNPDKTIWMVYNGEVYNFQDERRILEGKGYLFTSHSDTEVVLKMYEYYGDDFLLRLRGMFALAIYDKRRGTGRERFLLARDQFGIKPLLYARAGRRLLFASEIKPLLASGLIQPTINHDALRMLLTYGSIYQPHTMLNGVNMLLPAHRMIVESGRERVERYWTFGLDQRTGMKKRPYGELVDEVAGVMEESVRLQMVSDVPVGAFLSGGVDSSFLVGLMTRIAGNRVKTFSVGFEAEGAELDETDEAERTARFHGADHTRVSVRGTDVRDRITHFISGLDQPSVDGLNSYFVSLAARQAVTVAISGTGGDEVFAGYPWFAQMVSYEKSLNGADGKSRMTLPANGLLKRSLLKFLFSRYLKHPSRQISNRSNFLSHYGKTFQIFGHAGAFQLLSPGFLNDLAGEESLVNDIVANDELPSASAVERVSVLCIRGYTSNQLLRDIDAVSMSHSLEVRVPFLDVPLVDLAFSLPEATKLGEIDGKVNPYTATYRESGSKRILIDAGRRLKLLPEAIDCQPKRGFNLPIDSWLKGDLREIFEDALSVTSVRNRGFFRTEEVERIKQSFLDGNIHWTQPWLLMVIELWCRAYIDGSSSNPFRYRMSDIKADYYE